MAPLAESGFIIQNQIDSIMRESGTRIGNRIVSRAQNGQIIGIRTTATTHIRRLSGMPTRMKSVNR